VVRHARQVKQTSRRKDGRRLRTARGREKLWTGLKFSIPPKYYSIDKTVVLNTEFLSWLSNTVL
jgi:hypothetical protein